MIWLTFGKNSLKTRWLTEDIYQKNNLPKSLCVWCLMNRWLDCMQIWCGGSPGIFDDLFTFWGKIIENKKTDGRHFQKRWLTKTFVVTILYELLLDCIYIWCGGSLSNSDNLISFWKNPLIKNSHPKSLWGISFKLLVGSHSNLMQWFSRYF